MYEDPSIHVFAVHASLQGEAADVASKKRLSEQEVAGVLGSVPPPPKPDDKELESAHWFHRGFVADALQGAYLTSLLLFSPLILPTLHGASVIYTKILHWTSCKGSAMHTRSRNS